MLQCLCHIIYIAISKPLREDRAGPGWRQIPQVVAKEHIVEQVFVAIPCLYLFAQVGMVAVEINDHLVVHQLGDAAGGLPVE